MPYIYILPSPNKPKRLVSKFFDSREEAAKAANLVESKSESKPEIIEVHSKEVFKNSFKKSPDDIPPDVNHIEVRFGQTLEFKNANETALVAQGGLPSLVTKMTKPELSSMATQVKREVRTGLTPPEAARTGVTAKMFHHAMQPFLQLNRRLVELAVQGNEKAFLKLLEEQKDLNIFTQSAEGTLLSVSDYSYRTIFGSAYQALLGAGDVYLLNRDKLKAELEANPKATIEQFKEQFPQEKFPHFWVALEAADEKEATEAIAKRPPPVKTYDFPALMEQIISDPCNQACALLYRDPLPKPGESLGLEAPINAAYIRCGDWLIYDNRETEEYVRIRLNAEQVKAFDEKAAGMNVAQLTKDDKMAIADLTGHFHEGITKGSHTALKAFEKHFEQKATVKTGKHFEEADLLAAWTCYDANWDKLENLTRRSLWSRRILGNLEQDLAAVDAQVVSRGVGNIERARGLDQRSFKLDFGDPFFPLSGSPSNILGRTSFVDIDAWGRCACGGRGGVGGRVWHGASGAGRALGKLYQMKTRGLEDFIVKILRPLSQKLLQQKQEDAKSDQVTNPPPSRLASDPSKR